MNNVAKAPERQIQLAINLATKQVQIVILAHGHPVPSAAIAMTIEQAQQHVAGMLAAINAIKGSKSGLLLPPGIGAPFQA